MTRLRIQKRHPFSLSSLAWSPDGSSIAAGGYTKNPQLASVVIWQVTTGKTCWTARNLAPGFKQLAWSPDGRRLAGASWNGHVHVWQPATSQTCFTFAFAVLPGRSSITEIAWSPDGTHLAVSGWTDQVLIWETVHWQQVLTCHIPGDKVPGGYNLRWSPDGTRLACIGLDEDYTFSVWDATSGSLLMQWPLLPHSPRPDWRWARINWSSDSTRLALGFYRQVHIRDARTLELLSAIETPDIANSPGAVWSPDGSYLAIDGQSARHIQIWNTSKEQFEPRLTVAWRGGFSWSPDGRSLACGCGKNTLEIWEL